MGSAVQCGMSPVSPPWPVLQEELLEGVGSLQTGVIELCVGAGGSAGAAGDPCIGLHWSDESQNAALGVIPEVPPQTHSLELQQDVAVLEAEQLQSNSP